MRSLFKRLGLQVVVILLVSCFAVLAPLGLRWPLPPAAQRAVAGSAVVPFVGSAARCESALSDSGNDLRRFDLHGVQVTLAAYPFIRQWAGLWYLYMRKYPPINPADPQFNQIRRLIEITDEPMATRRGWVIGEERMAAAIKYWEQTNYFEVKIADKSSATSAHDTKAVLGLITAKDSLNQKIAMYDLKDELNGATWVKSLNRLRKEYGFLFEGKAYAIFKTKFDALTSPGARDRVWIDVLNQMREDAKDKPEVLDKKSFITFGDDTSIEFWRNMGFEVLGKKDGFPPLYFDHRYWYALRVEPSRLVHDQKKYTIPYGLQTPGQQLTLKLSNGLTLVADGDEGLEFPQLPTRTTMYFTSPIRQRLTPLMWVKPQGLVFLDNGIIQGAAHVEGEEPGSPLQINADLWIQSGGRYLRNGNVLEVGYLAKPYSLFEGRIELPVGTGFDLYNDGVLHAVLDREGLVYPGIWAAQDVIVDPESKPGSDGLTIWVYPISRPLKLNTGTILPAGSGVKISVLPHGASVIEKLNIERFQDRRNELSNYNGGLSW